MNSVLPPLSVIIPTVGRSDCLAKCLRALREQTIADNIEVILVDQNPDGFLHQHIAGDLLKWCRVIRLEQPNVSAARNAGGQASLNGLLLFLDDDMEPGSEFCEEMLKSYVTRPEVDCLVPVISNRKGDTSNLSSTVVTQKNRTGQSLVPLKDSGSAAFIISRAIFNDLGGFDPVIFDLVRSTEDKEFFSRLTREGYGLYLDTELDIFHSEEVDGGCGLRENSYWENRANFIKGWIYISYKRNNWQRLGWRDWWSISRSAFLNRQGLSSGFSFFVRNISLVLNGYKFITSQLEAIKAKNYLSVNK